MYHLLLLAFLAQLFAFPSHVLGSLEAKLRNYDVVYVERRSVVKRGAANPDAGKYNSVEEVTLKALDRQWRLFLTPQRGLLSPNFRAISINDETGAQNSLSVDPDEFLTGHLYGADFSRVTAHFDADGALTASVLLSDDTVVFEPAWRHLPELPLNASIAYRASDLRFAYQGHENQTSFCGFLQPDPELFANVSSGNNVFTTADDDDSFVRGKRQAGGAAPKTRCPIKLVADYSFFQGVGGNSTALTTRYLINLIDRVNVIYTQTVWREDESDPGLLDMGFMIKEVLVHTTPSYGVDHYNKKTDTPWSVDLLLRAFSELEGSRAFCLVHLFTSQAFKGGVLGLGYIASAKVGTAGGICSADISTNKGLVHFNTAFSSATSSFGDTVITREADIVTAHELGHNWGSPHDPQSNECSPNLRRGGSFIMHTYSVSGYDTNNKRFSPCSTRWIKAVLDKKSNCFEEKQDKFCGNQRVEKDTTGQGDDEQCDVGILSDSDQDPCCSNDCKLKQGMVCSPKNEPCCSSTCQFLPSTHICRTENRHSCERAARCSGLSGECPPSEPQPDRTACLDHGECQKGRCVSFCEKEAIGMKPCICANVSESCFRCCRESATSDCRPYGRPPTILSDHTRCVHGFCQGGVCEKEVQDVIEHLWNIVDNLDSSSFMKFLYDNLVMSVIIISLIFWIPASYFISRIDAERVAERQAAHDWVLSGGGGGNFGQPAKLVSYNPAPVRT